MCSVPQKFYELCRLCLSCDGVKLSIFDDEGIQRNFPFKIKSCLSIVVSTCNGLSSGIILVLFGESFWMLSAVC